MMAVDRRLGVMCDKQTFDKQTLVYSRFVDDIAISGSYPITSGSYPKLVSEVLAAYGFKVNPQKHKGGLEGLGRLADGKRITKLEIKRKRIRVRQEFIEEVGNQLSDAARLAGGEALQGYYYMANQIHGRIQFITWINQGQAVTLERRYRSINWKRVEAEARERGLVATRKVLRKKCSAEASDDLVNEPGYHTGVRNRSKVATTR
jgi:hypothetical protein